MAFPNQPFDERETRYFLAEILKASSVAPNELFNFIREREIDPSWMDMTMPNGRTPADCKMVFNALLGSSFRPPAPFQPHILEQQISSSKPKKRQTPKSDAPASVTDQNLHPQQLNFSPVNPISDSSVLQVVPTARATSAEERPGKKRGRPSKAEYEQRLREAAERGEVYPPPRKRKTPRASLEGVPGEGLLTPTKYETGAAGEGSTGRKKPRAKAAAKAASFRSQLGLEENPALETTAIAADEMQIDTGKLPMRSTIPETQSTDFSAQASLLSAMRDYTTQGEADTAQSSSTLRGDFSVPRNQREISGVIPATPDAAPAAGAQTDSATTKIEVTEPVSTKDQ